MKVSDEVPLATSFGLRHHASRHEFRTVERGLCLAAGSVGVTLTDHQLIVDGDLDFGAGS